MPTWHVHVKNEAGRDDNVTVDAADEVAAEVLAMNLHPTAVAAIGAYPAWDPAADQSDEGWGPVMNGQPSYFSADMAERDAISQQHHEFMAGDSDPASAEYHTAEAAGLFDDESGWGPGYTEPPAECFDDSGAFRGDPGWENRWDTYRLDHSEGWAR